MGPFLGPLNLSRGILHCLPRLSPMRTTKPCRRRSLPGHALGLNSNFWALFRPVRLASEGLICCYLPTLHGGSFVCFTRWAALPIPNYLKSHVACLVQLARSFVIYLPIERVIITLSITRGRFRRFKDRPEG